MTTNEDFEAFETDLFESYCERAEKLLPVLEACGDENLTRELVPQTKELIKVERELDGNRPVLKAAGITTEKQLLAMLELFAAPTLAVLGWTVRSRLIEARNARYHLRKYLADPGEVKREVNRRRAETLAAEAKEAESVLEAAKVRATKLGKMAADAMRAVTK